MTMQKHDTQAELATAAQILASSRKATSAFDTMRKETERLGDAWQGRAGTKSADILHILVGESRTQADIVRKFPAFLEKVAGEAVQTENGVKKLSDSFRK